MIIISLLSNKRGVALVAVTLLMVVAGLLAGAIVAQSSQDVQLAGRTRDDQQAFFLAESAKERGYQLIKDDDTFAVVGNPGIRENETIPLGDGTYDIDARTVAAGPPWIVRIVATGEVGQVGHQVEVVAEVEKENVNVWNNAIFGGSGQTGGVVNGNCAIHGSVHILGDGVGAGGSSIEALDLSGTALIHNNYGTTIPADLLAKLPPLPTTVVNGETVSTLNAKLRVKNGAVGVSGNSEIGQADVPGNGVKEKMDGIYIETNYTDTRWTGNQVSDGVPDSTHVQSDNGTNALYDLGDAVSMPVPEDLYHGYSTYDDYFDAEGLQLPFSSMTLNDTNSALLQAQAYKVDPSKPANVNITWTGSTFTISNSVTNRETGATEYNSISYNYNTARNKSTLTIGGKVEVQGNLIVGKKNLDITYSGRGTIYASGDLDPPDLNLGFTDTDTFKGDIAIHSNLLPAGTFPTVDVLGLVANDDMGLATGSGDSQLTMAGAFYARDTCKSSFQNEIAGAFVGQYFDMGTNVPRIYQVPELADNLPPGIIGNKEILIVTGFKERSWQEKMVTPD